MENIQILGNSVFMKHILHHQLPETRFEQFDGFSKWYVFLRTVADQTYFVCKRNCRTFH